MSYQVRRIDPYWMTHPMVPVLFAAGVVVAVIGQQADKAFIAIAGLVIAGAATLLGTKPIISAVLSALGLIGGLITFVILPQPQMVGMPVTMRLISTVLFSLLYMVLMDALVLVVAALYNFFGASLGGIHMEIEETAAPAEGTDGETA